MMRILKDRKDIDYVKPYTTSAWAKYDLDKMKEAFRYYRDKKERLKNELKEKGLWEDMPADYRFEMYALRTMLGILQVKITKCTAVFKKLQREESLKQEEERLKQLEKEERKRTREYKKQQQMTYEEEEKRLIEYYTEEDRKKIMSKVLDAANIIYKRTKKRGRNEKTD